MKKDLPLYYLEIDENNPESGLDAISFVDAPAIEINWYTFKKEEVYTFKADEVKRVVTAPVMLCEHPIYRVSSDGTEYNVKFSEETIFKMMKKYFRDNRIHNVNENHNPNNIVDNVTMIESFIVGDRTTSKLYPDLTKGSWVASFYIHDQEYWDNVIMSDEFTGFSLEGGFDLVEAFSKTKTKVEPANETKELTKELVKELLDSGKSDDEIYDELKSKLK